MNFEQVIETMANMRHKEEALANDFAMASRGYYTADDIARQFARVKALKDAIQTLVDAYNKEAGEDAWL